MIHLPRYLAAPGLCLALAAGVAVAAEPSTQAPAPATNAAAAAPARADAEANAPAPLEHPIALRDDAAVQVVVNADGSASALLDDSFLSTSVAKIGPDGEVIIGCVHTRAEYDAFFAAEALPAGAEVR